MTPLWRLSYEIIFECKECARLGHCTEIDEGSRENFKYYMNSTMQTLQVTYHY